MQIANLLRKLRLASRAALKQQNWPYLLAGCLPELLLPLCNPTAMLYAG